MKNTFQQQCQQLKNKLFNVTLTYPEPYLQALQGLIYQLLVTGASIHEARTAIQQLSNEWEPVLLEWEQKAHRLAIEKI